MRASTLLAMCLFALGSIGRVSATTELKVGDPAPAFTLKASNGRTSPRRRPRTWPRSSASWASGCARSKSSHTVRPPTPFGHGL
jgi:hypothetical protein